ncbi:lytic polysaccharide monooxygenase [Streptomyces sp. NPDC087218]|uniref:lytic polysaccharide monooxygenase n=1 Tax=Streptomyces sp. NPDC087218 TaxID=3365769 RepID=UPI00380C4F61
MTFYRKAAACAGAGSAAMFLTISLSVPAAAHGSMTDPVSRVSACYAEGVESPQSAACKAAVAASGKQAFYDWNAVNIANAAGKSKQIIPDGKLCSAANEKYRGLDLPRADWPSTKMSAGGHAFRYKGTAPHKGSFALYITKDSYDPTKPLKWSDLEAKPFVEVADPKMENGDYVFQGDVPARSGRHLIYSVWQRSDSPEAFYTCSDVVFGKDSGARGAARKATAPTDEEIAAGAGKSSVTHQGHGGGAPAPADRGGDAGRTAGAAPGTATGGANAPEANSAAEKPGIELAETGGDSTTPVIAIAGAAVLAIGAASVFAMGRRRGATGRR